MTKHQVGLGTPSPSAVTIVVGYGHVIGSECSTRVCRGDATQCADLRKERQKLEGL
jgi:hypothetical protein